MKSLRKRFSKQEYYTFMDFYDKKILDNFLKTLRESTNEETSEVSRLLSEYIDSRGAIKTILLSNVLKLASDDSSVEEMKECANRALSFNEFEHFSEDDIADIISRYIKWLKTLKKTNINRDDDYYHIFIISIGLLLCKKYETLLSNHDVNFLQLIDKVITEKIFPTTEKRGRGRPPTPYREKTSWIGKVLEQIEIKQNDIAKLIQLILGESVWPDYRDRDDPLHDYRPPDVDRYRRSKERYFKGPGKREVKEFERLQEHTTLVIEMTEENDALVEEANNICRLIRELISSYIRYKDHDDAINGKLKQFKDIMRQ